MAPRYGTWAVPCGFPSASNSWVRVLDVFGRTIDQGVPVDDVSYRSIHARAPTIARRATKSQIFATGIKAIDLLSPLERGGKAGLFGGAGVGKTVLITEIDS